LSYGAFHLTWIGFHGIGIHGLSGITDVVVFRELDRSILNVRQCFPADRMVGFGFHGPGSLAFTDVDGFSDIVIRYGRSNNWIGFSKDMDHCSLGSGLFVGLDGFPDVGFYQVFQ
jgi:hypothetical protein